MKALKVLCVTSTFPRFDGDDQVPWLHELALVLREKGVDLEVLAPTYAGLKSHFIGDILVHRYRYWRKSGEVVTHEAGAMNKLPGKNELVLPAFALVGAGMVAAARLTRRNRYDVIHSHWPLPMGIPAQVGAWATPQRRSGLVATFHGAEVALANRKSHYKPVLKTLTRNMDAAIANSSSTAATVEELTGVVPEVVPFGPPRGSVNLEKEIRGGSTGDELPVVLAVGRMIERKGFPVLVRAARKLRGKARVVIVGGGEYEDVVRREVSSRDVGDVVTLAGRVSDGELADLYSRCAVFCLPAVVDSRGETEGLGVVMIEAMSHGKPVVASNLGGIPDAVEDGITGLLIPPNDPDILAKSLLDVVSSSQLATRLGEAGRERAKRLFSWDNIAERHISIYEKSLSKDSRR